MSEISVLFIEPGGKFSVISMENDIRFFQDKVGGYVEHLTYPTRDCLVLCDEMAKYKSSPVSCVLKVGLLRGTPLLGNIIVTGINHKIGDSADVPDYIIDNMEEYFYLPS